MKDIHPEEIKGLRTWIRVDAEALAHNYAEFKKQIAEDVACMAVIKSNAYGHGLQETAKILEGKGADWFGVDSIMEGLSLRDSGITKPILVLGYTLPENYERAVEKNISLTISSIAHLAALKKQNLTRQLKVHIKIDTGMHRQGFDVSEVEGVAKEMEALKNSVIFEGIYTHFSSAKNPAFPNETKNQIEFFEQAITAAKKYGFSGLRHAAATAGTLLFPEAHYDMVRIGIGLYGLWPSPQAEAFCRERVLLRPVASWQTIISEVKKIKKGDRIGYDLIEAVNRNSTIAICPVGYWHGISRLLSSVGWCLVGDKKAKILGRVCMDMIIIDITDVVGCEVGTVVTLLGESPEGGFVSPDEMGRLSDTTSYEVVTRLNPLIRRIVK